VGELKLLAKAKAGVVFINLVIEDRELVEYTGGEAKAVG
jgi:hypothetical protein